MSSDRKRIAVYPDDAAFLRVVCEELGIDQAKAVARIFEDYRKWEAVDDKPRSFMQFPPRIMLQRVSVYPKDAEFVRELCDDIGLYQAEAVACIFEGFRDWIAMDATDRATVTDEKVAEVQADIRPSWMARRNAKVQLVAYAHSYETPILHHIAEPVMIDFGFPAALLCKRPLNNPPPFGA